MNIIVKLKSNIKQKSNNEDRSPRTKNYWFIFSIPVIIMLTLGIPKFMPYGYYSLLRSVVFLYSVILALIAWEDLEDGRDFALFFLLIFAFLAIIFNPIYELHLDKNIWIIVDIIAIFLIPIGVKRVFGVLDK